MITVSKALESSYNFWSHHNSKHGYPENYPDEEIVRFFKRNKIKKKTVKVLDLFSGSGKNSYIVIDLNYKYFSLDWVSSGNKYIKNRLKRATNFTCMDVTNKSLPYKDNFFDFIICAQVFDHIFRKDAKNLVKEVHRILKKDGKVIANLMLNETNQKIRTGKKIRSQKNTFLVSDGNSKGEIHSFFTKKESINFFKNFFYIDYIFDQKIIFPKQKEKIVTKYFYLRK